MEAEDNMVNGGEENGLTNGALADTNGDDPPASPALDQPVKIEEIVTPSVLQAIIQGYKPGMKLVKFEAQLGSNVGDNYMSIMYALEIELKDEKNDDVETLHCMLKTMPRNKMRIEMLNEMRAFLKESSVYQKILPVLIDTQKERGIPEKYVYSSWPTCYTVHLDGNTDYLAMENLRVQGYKMGNRAIGLDYNHCALVLRTLARHHAISYAKYGGDKEKMIKEFPMLQGSMWDSDTKMGDNQQQYMVSSFNSHAGKLREMGEDRAAHLMQQIATKMAICSVMKGIIMKPNPAAIITHGDCWLNNILFKYEDDDSDECQLPVDMKFIDFQLSLVSSRFLDIYYFIMSSTRMDVLREREQDLLLTYYSEFTSFAQLLGVDTKEKGLTWESFLEEKIRYKFYGVYIGLLFAPMLAAKSSDIPDMETLSEEDFNGSEESMKKYIDGVSSVSAYKRMAAICEYHLQECPEIADFQ